MSAQKTDRELLEHAAKAVGIVNYTFHGGVSRPLCLYVETGSRRGDSGYYWSPLANDGDAMRLSVRLGLLISHSAYKPAENAYGFIGIAWYGQKEKFEPEKFTDDPYAATRRAIVRAAAELPPLELCATADAEWEENTEWVHEADMPEELEMHHADALTARIAALEQANRELLAVLNKLEYSSDGDIKRYPEEAEVNAAIKQQADADPVQAMLSHNTRLRP